MPTYRTLTLSEDERTALMDFRDHAPIPYLRERAAALLKIAAGTCAAEVARSGLLRARKPDTVYAWLDRWRAEGLDGLAIRSGRGRKPAFSPSGPDPRGRTGGDPAHGAA